MFKALKKEDRVWLKLAAQKTSRKYRMQRRTLRAQSKKKDKNSYKSGSFGLGEKPETLQKERKRKATTSSGVAKKKDNNTTKKQKSLVTETVTIAFVNPELEVIQVGKMAKKTWKE